MNAQPARPRRRRRGDPSWGRLVAAILLSLGVHGAGLFFLVVLGLAAILLPSPKVVPKRTDVGLVQLPPSKWGENRHARADGDERNAVASAQPKPVEKQRPKYEPERPPGKVVDVQGNGQTPDEARFVAERASKVDRETFSKDATLQYKNAMPRPTTSVPRETTAAGKDDATKLIISGNEGRGDDDRPMKPREVKRRFEIPDIMPRDRLALRFDPYGTVRNREASEAMRGNSTRLLLQPGAEGTADEPVDAEASVGRKGEQQLVTLVPSAAALDKITGAPAADLTPLDGVDRGEGTFLNAREWKHASFFNRVKQGVGTTWDPGTALRRRDPTGQVYAYRDRYTVLSVILDSNGALKDLYVEKSSGVDFLDEEAIAAFQRAQPFPNPPLALVDPARNEIRFSFGFYLEVSTRPTLRIMRQGY